MSSSKLQYVSDSVEKAMEKLTELRLTFQMQNQQQLQNQKSALGTPLADLTSAVSNLLTSVTVELRSQIRLMKLEETQNQNQLHQHDSHNHSSSSPSSPCKYCDLRNETGNDRSKNSSSSTFCVHKTALADRVIDRAFDQHKAMLREELKEVKTELATFKSGAYVQSLQRRIDELELKLRDATKNNDNSMIHRKDFSDNNNNNNQEFTIDRNERNQIVGVSLQDEKRRRLAKMQQKVGNDDSVASVSLDTVDDMIANFKSRCDIRTQKRIEKEKEAGENQQQQQQNNKNSRVQQELDVENKNNVIFEQQQQQINQFLILQKTDSILSINFSNFMSAIMIEEQKVMKLKVELFGKSFGIFQNIAARNYAERIASLSALMAATTKRDEDQGVGDVSSQNVILSGRRKNSGKTLDVSKKPLHTRYGY